MPYPVALALDDPHPGPNRNQVRRPDEHYISFFRCVALLRVS